MDLVTFPVSTAAVTAPARPASAADPAPVASVRQAEPPATNHRPRPDEPAVRDASRIEEAGKPRALKPYGVIILPDREANLKGDKAASRASWEHPPPAQSPLQASSELSVEFEQAPDTDDREISENRSPDPTS